MRYNQLGKGGPFVSELGLGTMTFGAETEEAEAHRQLDVFVAAGGTFVDTADVYADGESESIVGRWLASRKPEDIVLATKARFRPPSGSSGASRRGIVKALDGSLQRLGVEAIDVFYVHGWDPDAALLDTLATLDAAVAAGKVHNIGWSNTTGWQLQQIVDTAHYAGLTQPVVFQPQYNLLDRVIEWELLPLCLEQGLAVCPWSPLGGGWLTGKYRRDTEPTGATRLGEDPTRGVEAYDKRNIERVWRIIDAIQSIADESGAWMGEVALRWLLARPGVTSVLLGARTVEQLHQSLAAADLELTTDQLARLTTVSAPGVPDYPYGMLEKACGMTVWQELGTANPEDR
ncbi:MAG: aldo/keto reductase [Acidimicrobiia bacterium]|nr:aldo/keto reductase [Acidimicrobiia bacterium]